MLKAVNHTIPGFEEGSVDEEEHIFIHGADPQYGFMDLVAGGEGMVWDKDIALLEKAIAAVNKMKPKPKFFFLNGDLVHALPGSGKHKNTQEEDILKTIRTSTVPVLVSCGNHDIGNEPTAESVEHFKSLFGDDYYSFVVGKSFYIVLNSQYLFDPTHMQQEAGEQMRWLLTQLERAKSGNFTRTIVFMHIPPFTTSIDDEDQYTHLPKTVRHPLLEEFARAGVQYVFSGHYHRNAGGIWEQPVAAEEHGDNAVKVEVVVSSAIGVQLGNDQSGITIVNVSKEGLKHQYFSLDDLPVNVAIRF